MSYNLDVTGAKMAGVFNTTYTVDSPGLTLACWIKHTVHPISADWLLGLHFDTTLFKYVYLETRGTDDQYGAKSAGAAGSSGAAYTSGAAEYDGVWTPMVGTFPGTAERNVFVGALANTGQNLNTRDPGAIDQISVGVAPNAAGDWDGWIAECAIWNTELSDANITSYMNGTAASGIDASNLIGYWPLDADNATQSNLGTDSAGDLTVTSATYAADHPTITGASVNTSIIVPTGPLR